MSAEYNYRSLSTLNKLRSLKQTLSDQLITEEILEEMASLEQAIIDDFRQVAINMARTINATIVDSIPKRSADSSPETITARREEIYLLLLSWAEKVDLQSEIGHAKGHLKRIGNYAQELAHHHITENQTLYSDYDPVEYASAVAKIAPLHDIGKICLPWELLTSCLVYEKNSPEKKIIEIHIECGRIILTIPGIEQGREKRVKIARDAAEGHHYPDYGKYTGLTAIIVGLADKLDAATSKRAYREALPFNQAVEECILPYQENEHYAPVITTFLKYKSKFAKLCQELHTQELDTN